MKFSSFWNGERAHVYEPQPAPGERALVHEPQLLLGKNSSIKIIAIVDMRCKL
jgi:hypothetical protein